MKVINLRKNGQFRTIYIGRGSPYGNPFTHLPLNKTKALVQVWTREDSIVAYEEWLRGNPKWAHVDPAQRTIILKLLPTLPEDAVLACYCKPKSCHGDVLVKLYYELQAAA